MPNAMFIAPFKPSVGLRMDRTIVDPLGSIVEPYSTEHWRFGADNPNLIGMKSGLQLVRTLIGTIGSGGAGYTALPTVTASDASIWGSTIASGAVTSVFCISPSSGSGVPTLTITGGGGSGATATAARAAAPTINASSITLGAGGRGNGLSLPFLGVPSQTIWAVVKKPADGSAQMLFNSSDSTIAAGQSVWKSASSNGYLARAAGMGSEGSGVALGSGGSPGDWLFIAVSFDDANGRSSLIGPAASTSTAGTFVPGQIPLALGNANFAGFSSVAMEVAELGYIRDRMSLAEMQKIYARSKLNQAARDVPISVV